MSKRAWAWGLSLSALIWLAIFSAALAQNVDPDAQSLIDDLSGQITVLTEQQAALTAELADSNDFIDRTMARMAGVNPSLLLPVAVGGVIANDAELQALADKHESEIVAGTAYCLLDRVRYLSAAFWQHYTTAQLQLQPCDWRRRPHIDFIWFRGASNIRIVGITSDMRHFGTEANTDIEFDRGS